MAIAAAFSVLSTGLHATNRKEMLRPTRLEILEGAVTLGDNGSIGGEPSTAGRKFVGGHSIGVRVQGAAVRRKSRSLSICPRSGVVSQPSLCVAISRRQM